MRLKSIKEVKNLKNKKVLLRVDCNVPLAKGKIKDDFRIKSALPTIKYLLEQGVSIIILNHLGRPKGQVVAELSNEPIAHRLADLLRQKIILDTEIIGVNTTQAAKQLAPGQILMLENIRFHEREEMNCKRLARQLAKLADLYVNDAFAVSHRKATSVSAITEFLPSYAGLLLADEIKNLSTVLTSQVKPKVAVIGGAKIETKVAVIKNLLKKMDYVLMGGAIANNVLKAMNYEIGRSLVDDQHLDLAKQILNNKLKVPVDVVVANSFSARAKTNIRAVGKINPQEIILDLGPDTTKLYSEIIKTAKLVVWNGPLGYFEVSKYKEASQGIAHTIKDSGAFAVIGGGETVQLIKNLKLKICTKGAPAFGWENSFISTGGGAMLEFLEGKVLPGIKPLLKK